MCVLTESIPHFSFCRTATLVLKETNKCPLEAVGMRMKKNDNKMKMRKQNFKLWVHIKLVYSEHFFKRIYRKGREKQIENRYLFNVGLVIGAEGYYAIRRQQMAVAFNQKFLVTNTGLSLQFEKMFLIEEICTLHEDACGNVT